MRIPQGVILIWAGTNASIPSGWTRETALDGKFPKAWGTQNPNEVGGAETHTHTSPPHRHRLNDHTHTYDLSEIPAPEDARTEGGLLIQNRHIHTGTTNVQPESYTSYTSVTYGPCSNEPPNKRVIFIKANNGALLQNNIIALYNSNTPPPNWSIVSELQGKYIRGAASGEDTDLITEYGSYTNVHDITHSHTGASHNHFTTSSVPLYPPTRQPFTGGIDNYSSGSSNMYWNHTHSFYTDYATEQINQFTGSLTTTETVEPEYATLQAIKKENGGRKEKGIIGLWLGSTSNIPKGWVLCDGNNNTKDLRNKFIKIGDPSLPNGGSNTHTHAAQSHSHTSQPHNHTGSVNHQQTQAIDAVGSWTTARTGTHYMTNVSSVAAGYSSASTTADVADNQPPYRTVAYIQFQKEIYGGAALTNFL